MWQGRLFYVVFTILKSNLWYELLLDSAQRAHLEQGLGKSRTGEKHAKRKSCLQSIRS